MYNHLYGPRVGGDQGYGSNRVSGREIYKDMDLDSLAEKLARNPQRLTLEERMAAIWHPQVVHGPVHKTANLGQNPQRYYDMRGATRMDPTVGGYHPSGFGGTAVAPDPYPSVPGSASYGAYWSPGFLGVCTRWSRALRTGKLRTFHRWSWAAAAPLPWSGRVGSRCRGRRRIRGPRVPQARPQS
eukprot:TRINITY_DN1021_c0_g1_i3.p3 TRINITY_DN1021_c0_g1~~TRINITY_DN1021_c0_g1_i3.p3  ORF type:complete len:193 (-),score=12.65 TRINITY_DN1021_c0_g1_i3:753-1307(-)